MTEVIHGLPGPVHPERRQGQPCPGRLRRSARLDGRRRVRQGREQERHHHAAGRRTSPRAWRSRCIRRSSRTSRRSRACRTRTTSSRRCRTRRTTRRAWAKALGRQEAEGLQLHIPAAVAKSTKALTSTGTALETAFVETYLGAVETLSSTELSRPLLRSRPTRPRTSASSTPPTVATASCRRSRARYGRQQAAAILKKDGFLS